MSETVRDPSSNAFWRCGRCGTPNPSRPYLTHCLGCGTAWAPEPPASRARGQAEPASELGRSQAHRKRTAAPPGPVRATVGRVTGLFTWAWALTVLVVLALIRCVGARWWGVAVLLFLPRWLFLAPLPVLALASGVAWRPRQWLLQGVVTLMVAGPLMALSLPLHQLWDPPVAGTPVRIMTLNRASVPLDNDRLIALIERARIDLICFQEFNHPANAGFEGYLAARGWHFDRTHYVASRYPIVAELPPLVEESDPEHRYPAHLVRVRVRAARGVEFGVASVHMPTLRFGFYRFLEYDVEGLKRHEAWWDRQAVRMEKGLGQMRDLPLLVGGDFNLPPDHSAMAALGDTYRFAFEDAGWGYGYTRPARYPWFRIDHILASPDWVFTRCWVGPDVGSDHLPLMAEAVLPAPAGLPEADGARAGRDRE